MYVCTAEQMREIDRTAIEDYGIPGVVLMEIAGRGVVAVLTRLKELKNLKVSVLCGSGNNGGDGYVVARHLASRGANVTVFLLADEARIKGDALVNLEIIRKLGVQIRSLRDDDGLAAGEPILTHAHVLVDALLGTGLSSPVRGQYLRVIELANRCNALKVAVDIPSGLHADNGSVLGLSFRADHTVTFGYPKVGLVSHPGADRVGQVHVIDIGIPAAVEHNREFAAQVLDEAQVGRWLLHRPSWGHKGTFGHLLVIAGSEGKTGAAILAGEAALRAGAGLVTIASPSAAMRAMECKTREVMLAPLTPDDLPPDDSDRVFGHLGRLLAGKTAVALGPGIERGPGMRALVRRLLAESRVPLVIDADGLNELAMDLGALERASVPVLLTPHPGEMSRLCATPVNEIQQDRLTVARTFARQHGAFLALKGSRTVVAGPDGRVYINPTGNSGMGSGGTGDVLTGLVGGLLAQGYPPMDALAMGVFVHGLAGDRAAENSGTRSLVASDLLGEVGWVLKSL